MDTDRIIRVRCQLHNSALTESEKHQMILPAKHQTTLLLIEDTNLFTLHGGPFLTYNTLNRQFWLLRGHNTERHVERQHVIYARHKDNTMSQLMGLLPPQPFQPSSPFTYTGIDYADPIWYKASPEREKRAMKGYLASSYPVAPKPCT
ncbi:uncharacterized protein LOC106638797 [Copidosoma floridanum]|uniref:uncharacterized protein LOC106638797 n=1 Tax=Copidosoma floridanum TaxID=29053 RepID=UPI0006C99253|nr:uncharacterized protein LOC106638797 [Copidosoma floridanum]